MLRRRNNQAYHYFFLHVFYLFCYWFEQTQLLYLGNGPHPEVGACLADMSQAMGELWGFPLNSVLFVVFVGLSFRFCLDLREKVQRFVGTVNA